MSALPTLIVLSLRGGVRSSVMALIPSQSLPPSESGGSLDRAPDCVIDALHLPGHVGLQ